MVKSTMTNQSSFNISEEKRLEILKAISHRELERLIPSIVILSIFSLTGTVGNSVSVYVFASRMKRNFQNNLFIYLCSMNIMACAVCVPGDIVDLVFAFNYPSTEICKATRFFNLFTVTSYVVTLGTISVYRLRAASTASLTLSVKRTSIRGIVGIFIASLAMAWLGAVVYGVRRTPTGVQGIKGQDCSIAEEVSDTAWPAGFYSFLGIGFTTLVLTVAISYYRIWQIVKRSKTTVAAHTTINVVAPVATGLAVVTSQQERSDRQSQAQEGEEPLKQDVVSGMYDLMPSASSVYQEASVDYYFEKEGSDLSAPSVSKISCDNWLNGNTQTSSQSKNNIKSITTTDVCGVTTTCLLDDQDGVVSKDKIYERFNNNLFKRKNFPLLIQTTACRRNKRSGQFRSNPDLASLELDDQASALFRSLSVVELGHRGSHDLSMAVEPKKCSWLDFNKDLKEASPKCNIDMEAEGTCHDSTFLLLKKKSGRKSSLANITQLNATAKKNELETDPSLNSKFHLNPFKPEKENLSSQEQFVFSNAASMNSVISTSSTAVQVAPKDKIETDTLSDKTKNDRLLNLAATSTEQSLIPIQTTAKTKNSKTALENAITRTAFLLTFTFIASYVPFFVVSIPHFLIADFDYTQNTATLNVINMAYRLYFINPTISPFIFWASNLDFRRGIKAFCNRD
uniref:G-protein coupled receptors family 1 profile domain-containing protein n=1 Tax=Biomphalaria glabrata TaxID=6526 RepID=A0A2C9KRF5_BIOGL